MKHFESIFSTGRDVHRVDYDKLNDEPRLRVTLVFLLLRDYKAHIKGRFQRSSVVRGFRKEVKGCGVYKYFTLPFHFKQIQGSFDGGLNKICKNRRIKQYLLKLEPYIIENVDGVKKGRLAKFGFEKILQVFGKCLEEVRGAAEDKERIGEDGVCLN